MVGEGFIEEVALERCPEDSRESSHADIWGECPDKGNSKHKSSEVWSCVMCSRNMEEQGESSSRNICSYEAMQASGGFLSMTE